MSYSTHTCHNMVFESTHMSFNYFTWPLIRQIDIYEFNKVVPHMCTVPLAAGARATILIIISVCRSRKCQERSFCTPWCQPIDQESEREMLNVIEFDRPMGSAMSAKADYQVFSNRYRFSVNGNPILCPVQPNQFSAVVDKIMVGDTAKMCKLAGEAMAKAYIYMRVASPRCCPSEESYASCISIPSTVMRIVPRVHVPRHLC